MLDPVPCPPIRDGDPAFGTYAGRCGDTDLRLRERGVSRLRRAVSEKRWQWFAAFDDGLAVGGAVVDGGLFGTAFYWLFDRERDTLTGGDVVVPSPLVHVTTHPTVGQIAAVDLPGRRLRMDRRHGTLTVEGRFPGVELSLAFAPDDDRAITAVCPVEGRRDGVNVTQKEPAVSVTGTVGDTNTDGGEQLDGVGFLDYSHGLLGRETRWDWAFAAGRTGDGVPVAFNLVDRFNDGRENAVWVDGEPRNVGEATLSAGEAWRVRTACGTVDASLAVEGRRSKDIDIGLVRSRYDQPLGRWCGTVAGHDIEAVGVAEQQLTRW